MQVTFIYSAASITRTSIIWTTTSKKSYQILSNYWLLYWNITKLVKALKEFIIKRQLQLLSRLMTVSRDLGFCFLLIMHHPTLHLKTIFSWWELYCEVFTSKCYSPPPPNGTRHYWKIEKDVQKQILHCLLLPEGDNESVVDFSKEVNIKDCCYMLGDAWSRSDANLKNMLQNLWGAAAEMAVHEQDLN